MAIEGYKRSGPRPRGVPLWGFFVSAMFCACSLAFLLWQSEREMRAMGARLTAMEATQRVFSAAVAEQRLKEMEATLQAASLASDADALALLQASQRGMDTVRALHVPMPAGMYSDLASAMQTVLDTHPDLVESWELAGQLVSYQSDGGSQAPWMSTCFVVGENTSLHRVPDELTFSNCKMDLGDLAGSARYPLPYKPATPDDPTVGRSYFLRDALLVYNGGEPLPYDKFECHGCRVDLHEAGRVPPAAVQQLIRKLLGADPVNFAVDRTDSESAGM
jgi:hypothetical protein